MSRILTVGLSAGALLSAETAMAGGFHSPYQSATAMGTAFAGASIRSDDAGFFLTNPATISGLAGSQSWLDLCAFSPHGAIRPGRAEDALGRDITGAGASGNIAAPALAPGSVTAIRLHRDWTVGIGSSAPFATDIETKPEWGGRFHLLRTRMVGANVSGAVSWQATQWLAVAAGLQVQRFETKFQNAALIPTGGGIVEGRATMEGASWSTGVVGGAVFTPAEGTRIGVGWRSAVTHDIKGRVTTDIGGIPVEQVRYDVDLPQTISLGLEQRAMPGLRVFGEVQWVDWSRFKGFEIGFLSGRPSELRPITWKDTWLYAAGFGYRVGASTELTAGIARETAAAVNASGTTLSADASKTTLGIGLIQDMDGWGRLTISYAHVFVDEARVYAANPSSGVLDGKLGGRMDALGASWSIRW